MKERIETGLPQSRAPSNWAIKAGNILYTVHWACLPDGTCAPGDITEQTQVTLSNLKQALAAAGGTLADVVQIQVFITDKANFDAMNEVYKTFFEPPYPNRATIVSDIMVRGGLIEVVVQAHIGISAG